MSHSNSKHPSQDESSISENMSEDSNKSAADSLTQSAEPIENLVMESTDTHMSNSEYRTGYIAIVGRPNVGKSTLLNKILGLHLSITSRKPQTTRHRILGIKTTADFQAIYIDTPGLHKGYKGAIHKYMNQEATNALNDVDVVVFLLDGMQWTEEDDYVLKNVKRAGVTTILALNKVDLIKDKDRLLPYLEKVSQKMDFAEVVPISANKGSNVEALEAKIASSLHNSPAYYDEEQLTDKSDRFLAAELIREQLMRLLGQELPYSVAVEIEAFEEQPKIIKISALVWTERKNQKSIIIGQNGQQLKEIGKMARLSMERLFNKKVYLKLWVKVKEGWSNDERALKSLGYHDPF